MAEIAKLVEGPQKPGYLDEAAARRTVRVLLSGSSKPVITRPPTGAWTRVVWDQAFSAK
jgi:NitT/TauT family transport system substrate-binding protein